MKKESRKQSNSRKWIGFRHQASPGLDFCLYEQMEGESSFGVGVPARIVRVLARPGGTLLGSCHLHNFLGLAVSPGTLDPRVLALGYAQTPVEEMVCAFSAWLGTWAGLNLQGLVMGSNGGRRRQKKPSPAGGGVCVLSRFGCVQPFVTLWTVCSPTGSSVHGILQGRILEWIAMPSFRGSSGGWVRTSHVYSLKKVRGKIHSD